jgi:hypothetical protein
LLAFGLGHKANVLKREEIRMKGEEDNKKKDCIKDMHPSNANIILMASAVGQAG